MTNKRKDLLPDHREYQLTPGFAIGAHKHSCLFCQYCTDLFWDYTNGPYMFLCEFDDTDLHEAKEHDPGLSFKGECPAFEEETEANEKDNEILR